MNVSKLKERISRWLLAYAPAVYALLTGRRAFAKTRGVAKPSLGQPAKELDPMRILVVDHDFPEPSRDAGSRAIFQLMELLRAKADVTFWCVSTSPSEAGRGLLKSIGVRPVSRGGGCDLDQWLLEDVRRGAFVAAVLSRPMVAAMYYGTVRKYVAGVCAYYGHDVHHVRLSQMGGYVALRGLQSERREISRIEKRLWSCFDVVFYPSEEEVHLVNAFRKKIASSRNAIVMPLWEAPRQLANVNRPRSRHGMLFVGSFEHPPNIDGLNWFFREILPLVRSSGCEEHVYVVGSDMERYRPPTNDANVTVLGRIDEQSLIHLYNKVRVSLAPLRFGGGVKGKVIESLGVGTPCVATSTGVQGLGWARAVLEPRDNPEDFAAAVVDLLRDDALWSRISSESLRLIATAHDPKIIRERLYRSLGVA